MCAISYRSIYDPQFLSYFDRGWQDLSFETNLFPKPSPPPGTSSSWVRTWLPVVRFGQTAYRWKALVETSSLKQLTSPSDVICTRQRRWAPCAHGTDTLIKISSVRNNLHPVGHKFLCHKHLATKTEHTITRSSAEGGGPKHERTVTRSTKNRTHYSALGVKRSKELKLKIEKYF